MSDTIIVESHNRETLTLTAPALFDIDSFGNLHVDSGTTTAIYAAGTWTYIGTTGPTT